MLEKFKILFVTTVNELKWFPTFRSKTLDLGVKVHFGRPSKIDKNNSGKKSWRHRHLKRNLKTRIKRKEIIQKTIISACRVCPRIKSIFRA